MLDTIAAISAFGGQNAISIVRLCGQDALSIARKLTRKNDFYPNLATLSDIYDSNAAFIDSAIVIYFKAPKSYNGEDIVELQCHGGKTIAKMLLNECLINGARIAHAGEFTKIALLNQKIDLAKAEAISALINSTNEKSAKLLARQLNGSMSEFVSKIRNELLELLAHCEVNIDYAEEDLPLEMIEMICQRTESVSKIIESTLRASKRRRSLFDGLKIGIIGKPNVGKSSLLNSLLEYDRAIVSDIAGTTRDTVEESINIGEYSIRLVDTAGIRHSECTLENIGIEHSYKTYSESDIVLALFDGSRESDSEDEKVLELLERDSEKIILALITKSDLPRKFVNPKVEQYSSISICAKESCSDLENMLKKLLDDRFDSDNSEILINDRQITACQLCFDEINASMGVLRECELELFAFHVKEAIEAIGSITSAYDNEEMLDHMFTGFCVGK